MLPDRISARPQRYGVSLMALSLLGLVGLRIWASPVGRSVTGRETVSLGAFLGIPVGLGLLALGILLFLRDPEVPGA